jgi:peroxin-7
MALRLRTETFAHHNAAWSPFFPDRIAIASAQNFGLVGNGRLHLATLDPKTGLSVAKLCVWLYAELAHR